MTASKSMENTSTAQESNPRQFASEPSRQQSRPPAGTYPFAGAEQKIRGNSRSYVSSSVIIIDDLGVTLND